MAEHGNAAQRRVWTAVPGRQELETDLSPTDLQTVLLSVAQARAAAVTPARLLRRWREDRFVRPSAYDPRPIAQVEARIWSLLPSRFAGVELSPVAPLGTASALSTVPQNNVVSTVRGTEVLSDSTNALALEAADRRSRETRVDVAACHRVLRAQRFGPGAHQHFRLFAAVSSARDRGSGRTEADLLIDHIGLWQRVLAELLPGLEKRLTVTVFDHPVLAERLADSVHPALRDSVVPLIDDPDRVKGRGYYTSAALGVRATDPTTGVEVDLGDGGFTTWTAQVLGDAKERCLTSCIATERLSDLTSAVDVG
jgi:hypothetical protein